VRAARRRLPAAGVLASVVLLPRTEVFATVAGLDRRLLAWLVAHRRTVGGAQPGWSPRWPSRAS